jgi:hypothetical protein
VFDVIARLRESGTFFALNHLLHGYRGQAPIETSRSQPGPGARDQNGATLEAHNHPGAPAGGEAGATPMAGGRERRAHAPARRPDVDGSPHNRGGGILASLAAGPGRPEAGMAGGGAVAGDTHGAIGRYGRSMAGDRATMPGGTARLRV